MGDKYLEQLLFFGATLLIRYAGRKPARVASVGIVNKVTRIAWAVTTRGGLFERGHQQKTLGLHRD